MIDIQEGAQMAGLFGNRRARTGGLYGHRRMDGKRTGCNSKMATGGLDVMVTRRQDVVATGGLDGRQTWGIYIVAC